MERLALLLTCGLLLVATGYDVATRIIPNWVCAGALASGVATAFLHDQMVEGLISAVVVFFVLYLIWIMRLLGAGDVKFAAALASGLPGAKSALLLVYAALSGGLLSLVCLAAFFLVRRPIAGRSGSLVAQVLSVDHWRMARRLQVPYGSAIAAGALIVLAPTLQNSFGLLLGV